jgi:hypothetical protein
MPRLIQPLPEGPLDIVGDVHGEIEALLALLHRLGVDPERRRAERPLVFVGDLVDRGPDSVAVVELFGRLQDAGIAHAVAGNHELNLLADDRKEGNGWCLGHADHAVVDGRAVPFRSRAATPSERAAVRTRLATLPLVLERPDLRVVHACWDADAAARLPDEGDVAGLAATWAAEIDTELAARGVPERAKAERAAWRGLLDFDCKPDRHLAAVAEEDAAQQTFNPIKLLTSGPEVEVAPGAHYHIGGKWRFVSRDRWWLRGVDRPTVVGHYWRRRGAPIPGKLDVWDDVPTWAWAGGVFCVDYSVGRRYAERVRGRTERFDGGLGAMRWPERVVVFDDESAPRPTFDAPTG